MSLLITFEGGEGTGKTTQIALLAERLKEAGREVVLTREPGGCPIADAIRAILLDSDHRAMTPRTELLLYAAARAQHVEEVICPALSRGATVLCDRFSDATTVYQGFARGLDRPMIEELNRLATGGLEPDLTLLLDLPAQTGLDRAMRRIGSQSGSKEDRFEQEGLSFHQRIRDGYLELASRLERMMVIDAAGSVEEVAERISAVVDPRLRLGEPS